MSVITEINPANRLAGLTTALATIAQTGGQEHRRTVLEFQEMGDVELPDNGYVTGVMAVEFLGAQHLALLVDADPTCGELLTVDGLTHQLGQLDRGYLGGIPADRSIIIKNAVTGEVYGSLDDIVVREDRVIVKPVPVQ